MIPINDAITTAVVAMVAAVAIVWWAAAGYYRSKVSQAYQDGHAAGIATQIGRYHRAHGRKALEDRAIVDAYLDRVNAIEAGHADTEVIVGNVTDAAMRNNGGAVAQVIPFPEGLPPDLRDFATAAMQAADKYKWGMLP